MAVCHGSTGSVRARSIVNKRLCCPLRRGVAVTVACALAAICSATASSISVFTPSPRSGHNEPKRQPDSVQRRIEKISTQEAFNAFHGSGEDVLVMVTFPWCRSCRFFKPTFKKLARIYGDTQFSEICGNENDFTKHYAQEVLNVKFSPMFALYTEGKLVKTWTGNCHEEFVKNVEQELPTAKGRMRQALVDAGYA